MHSGSPRYVILSIMLFACNGCCSSDEVCDPQPQTEPYSCVAPDGIEGILEKSVTTRRIQMEYAWGPAMAVGNLFGMTKITPPTWDGLEGNPLCNVLVFKYDENFNIHYKINFRAGSDNDIYAKDTYLHANPLDPDNYLLDADIAYDANDDTVTIHSATAGPLATLLGLENIEASAPVTLHSADIERILQRVLSIRVTVDADVLDINTGYVIRFNAPTMEASDTSHVPEWERLGDILQTKNWGESATAPIQIFGVQPQSPKHFTLQPNQIPYTPATDTMNVVLHSDICRGTTYQCKDNSCALLVD